MNMRDRETELLYHEISLIKRLQELIYDSFNVSFVRH